MTTDHTKPFLTARWENLVLLNFRCPEALLRPLVPSGTELDLWEGEALISLVGFLFLDTRVKGVPIPGHRNFEEVNLRFYVRRTVAGDVRRGVVFIKELVPHFATATVARLVYNEPYSAVSMDHSVELSPDSGGQVAYRWRFRGAQHSIRATVAGAASDLRPGSEAEFITEHYWGYNRQRDGSTLEYRVEHPSWKVWDATDAEYRRGGTEGTYSPEFEEVLGESPVSAHVAVGSEICVYSGAPIVAS